VIGSQGPHGMAVCARAVPAARMSAANAAPNDESLHVFVPFFREVGLSIPPATTPEENRESVEAAGLRPRRARRSVAGASDGKTKSRFPPKTAESGLKSSCNPLLYNDLRKMGGGQESCQSHATPAFFCGFFTAVLCGPHRHLDISSPAVRLLPPSGAIGNRSGAATARPFLSKRVGTILDAWMGRKGKIDFILLNEPRMDTNEHK